MFEHECKFYRDAKCLKKNAFCDLKCDIDGFDGEYVSLRKAMDTEGTSENGSDLINRFPLRLQGTAIEKK